MDFISAFGNLRARNYGIEEIDKFAAKLKARSRRDLAAISPRPRRDLALLLDLP